MSSRSLGCRCKAVLVVFGFFLFSFFVPLFLCSDDVSLTGSCVGCHIDIREEFQESVHARSGVSCHHCHGGDPTQDDYELAMSKEAGFLGVPDKKQIAETCGGCHADVEFMNPWGIRTDQLARYRTSAHGKLVLEKEDFNAASCTDCHGYHKVVDVKDSTGPIYPTNLPHTCNVCHGRKELMSQYGLPSDIFDKYSSSVHGVALFEKGDSGAATCASCHGGHGAVPLGVKEVSSACGKCHLNEHKYFLESVHAKPMEEGIFSGCDSCHGYHAVQPPSLELYRTVCTQCHADTSAAVERGKNIYETLQAYRSFASMAEQEVKQAAGAGIFVEEEAEALEKIQTQLVVGKPQAHSLSLQQISKYRKAVVEAAENIVSTIHQKKQNLKWRKWALIPVWVFVLIMMWALWETFSRLKSKEERKKAVHSDRKEEFMTRRDFLGWLVRGGIFATLAGFVAPAVAYLWPVRDRGSSAARVEVGSVDDIPVWGAKKVVMGGSPILVIRTPKGFKALSAICTHLGCIVDWKGKKRQIECPCHAGVFDVDGKVISGPPPRPLPEFTVEVQGGKVFVKL